MELSDMPKAKKINISKAFKYMQTKKLQNDPITESLPSTDGRGSGVDVTEISDTTEPHSLAFDFEKKKERLPPSLIIEKKKGGGAKTAEEETIWSSTTSSSEAEDATTVQYDENGNAFKEKNLFNSKSMRNRFLSKMILKSKKKITKYATCFLTPFILAKLALSVF